MELTKIVEALVFAAPDPLTTKEIARSVRRATEESLDPAIEPLKKTSARDVQAAIDELSETFNATGRAIQFVETSSGWRIFSRPEFASYIRALLPETKPERLSPPALETLAIIAYRQPITKADIEAVRGVSVDGVMQKIVDRGLVKIGGRADLPGRPLLYETTDAFLDHFGIKNLDDLPNSGELRKIDLPSAEDSKDAEQMTLDEAAARRRKRTEETNSEAFRDRNPQEEAAQTARTEAEPVSRGRRRRCVRTPDESESEPEPESRSHRRTGRRTESEPPRSRKSHPRSPLLAPSSQLLPPEHDSRRPSPPDRRCR